jgi:hypothetical protein
VVESTLGPDGRRQFEAPGAQAQGWLHLPPGSFTLAIPGARISGVGGPGVTVTSDLQSLRFDAPAGGDARWRVSSVAGEAVIPDLATYVSGLDWRFRLASFPEPSPPQGFRVGTDRKAAIQALYEAVRKPHEGRLPGVDALHPRPLNLAWKSGWLTGVERALILDRLLGQQNYVTAWVLTGEAAEPLTLTGYESMLLAVHLDDEDLLLDPSCTACAFGEVSTTLAGRPAVGATESVPLQKGRLERTISLAGDTFSVHVRASGAAALWLREVVSGMSALAADEHLAKAVGAEGGVVTSRSGFDTPGESVELRIDTKGRVKPPFEAEPPWDGGWADI